MKIIRIPGLLGYLSFMLWFLLVVLAPQRATAAEDDRVWRASDIVPEIEAALWAAGAPDNAAVVLASPDTPVSAPGVSPGKIETTSYNPHTGRFIVRIAAANGAPTMAIGGVAAVPLRMPVPRRDISRDEVIGENDLEWAEIVDVRAAGYILHFDELIDTKSRRPLSAGRPVRTGDVQSAVFVKRGDMVTLMVEAPGMRLTHTGVALQSGGRGDLIEIRNPRSARTVRGVVVGKNLALAPSRLHAAAGAHPTTH